MGTYAANAGQGLSIPCPHRLSAPEGSTSCSICDTGFYLRNKSVDRSELILQPDLHCVDCPEHATCTWNTTLTTLGVPRNRWRSSFLSDELHICPDQGDVDDSACLGSGTNASSQLSDVANPVEGSQERGDGAPYCKPWHRGPRCEACVRERDYYDAHEHRCLTCPEPSRLVAYLMLAAGSCAVVGACFRMYVRRAGEQYRRLARRIKLVMAVIGLQAKFKITLSFLQVRSLHR